MKWIILLALISCGKHTEPTKKDLGDSDGDQVLNYEESNLSKYIADFEPLGLVKGVMKVHLMGEIQEISLSNELDLQKNALTLMAVNERKNQAEDYFQEWSRLRLQSTPANLMVKKTQYQLFLQFENGSDSADEIILIHGKDQLTIAKWSPQVKIQLSGEKLQALLNGEANFALKKSFKRSEFFSESKEETIRNKTYRVHFFDGKRATILYVSNELSFPDLMKHLGINQAQSVSEDKIFFSSTFSDVNMWYSRELSDKDKIIAFTNLNILREKMLENYVYQKTVLTRTNGEASSRLEFKNPHGANVYLRISDLHFTNRTFVEKKKVKRHGYGGGGGREGSGGNWYDCTHFVRSIKHENRMNADLPLLFENINQHETLLSAEIQEEFDSEEVYWKLKLNDLPEHHEWQFSNRPSSTFTLTGEYANSCGSNANRGRGASHKTNLEGKFSVVLESYVEKIN